MVGKRNGFAHLIKVFFVNGEDETFDGYHYFEFKPQFLEICSNEGENTNLKKGVERHLFPLTQIKKIMIINKSEDLA